MYASDVRGIVKDRANLAAPRTIPDALDRRRTGAGTDQAQSDVQVRHDPPVEA